MKVIETYILKHRETFSVLYKTDLGKWFHSSTGAFGQRDMRLVHVSEHQAQELIEETASQTYDQG